jgi:ketoreductase RED1
MLTGERMIVREAARYWWLFLVSGILWLLIAWMVLRLNATSIATVGVLLGVVFLLAGINEVGVATLSHGGWKVWHYILAVIFFLGALYGFIRPVNTFFALASVLGLILIFYGAFEIVQGVASRAVNPYWVAQPDHRDPADAAGVLGVGVRPGVRPGPADLPDLVLGGLPGPVPGLLPDLPGFHRPPRRPRGRRRARRNEPRLTTGPSSTTPAPQPKPTATAQEEAQHGIGGRPGYHRATVVGGGVIGISWTALFLAYGLDVTVCDPLPDVAERVRAGLREIAPTLAELGLSVDELTDSTDALRFDPDAASAVAGTNVVQENGPERPEVKQQLWSAIGAGAPANALLASSSSSSGIPASVMSQAMRQPGRLVIGHPFNPPHLVPLVEVVPSPGTDPEVVEAAVAFYRAMGKQPQVLSREIPGFVANRLQAALFREAVHLVAQGVVTEQELDAVVTSSIGMRWAVAGPFQTFHLGVDLAAWPTSSCPWVRPWRPCGRSWARRAWMPTRPGSS